MGRVIQERYGLEPQVALTMPLLIGTDGDHKMSQSLGNYIGVGDEASEMFGKTMSIPDELIGQWLLLAADVPEAEVSAIEEGMAAGTTHPNAVKRDLARRIVALYWGEEAGRRAEAAFDLVHKHREVPDDIPEHEMGSVDPVSIPLILREAGLTASAGEARRLITQGAVKVDGAKIDQVEMPAGDLRGRVLQVGKRRFVRLV
jgi:tyrosyl-tRNA synthetase